MQINTGKKKTGEYGMSIKEEIEWFRPEDKLPEENSLIMFVVGSRCLLDGFYKNYKNLSKKQFHLQRDFGYEESFYQSDVKYWAYLPEGPKND